MRVFDDITLSWRGRQHVVPADKVMGAIARVEDVLTLDELARFRARGATPFGKLATAYASVLRYTGAKVEDDEVYASMFAGGTDAADVSGAVVMLMAMMLPPNVGKPSKEHNPGNVAAAVRSTSKRRSKSRLRIGA